jgi:hypothetical protein
MPSLVELASVRTADKLDAALAYARLGFPVLPLHGAIDGGCSCRGGRLCELPAKHKLWVDGLEPAPTTSASRIQEWWSRYPFANVATPTGARAGFWALDIDAQPASEVLHRLVGSGLIPYPQAVARSGRGGLHAYIPYAQMTPPVASGSYLVPGVDVLAGKPPGGGHRGSYAMLPPSATVGRYCWL